MLDKVMNTVNKSNLLKKGDTALIALSGGPDSTALLLVLHELKTKLDLKLFAVHINYHLRGEESNKDEEFAGKLCSKLQIPFKVYSFETKKLIERRSLRVKLPLRIIKMTGLKLYLCGYSAEATLPALPGCR